MSSHKEYRKEKEIQTQDFSLDEKLRALNNKDMYNLMQALLNKNPEVRKTVLAWFMNKSEDMKNINREQVRKALNEELLWEHWYNAKSIISQFNEYGGGSEDEENECYDYLGDIEDIAEKGKISTESKFEFMDELFEEYNVGNSGFEDKMMDICFTLCKTKEEWQYLVKKLGEKPTEWRRDLIMQIQKKYLQDDDAYLKMRKEDLRYGMDYWDLAEFYIQRGEIKKAVEITEDGLLNGDGRLTELFEFLSNYYAKSRDTTNLERIVQYALKKKSNEKVMLDRLFEYYKTENDYENAKRALLKAFEYVGGAGYIPEVRAYAHYNKMKWFLVEADWKDIEPKIIQEVREKDLEDYLRICLDKNLKKEVILILLNPPPKQPSTGFRRDIEYNFDEFANRLKEEFPEEVIKYYWQKAYRNISGGNRNAYYTAANYLAKGKEIYINIILKDEDRWNQRFDSLKVEFKKRPAFLKEVSRL